MNKNERLSELHLNLDLHIDPAPSLDPSILPVSNAPSVFAADEPLATHTTVASRLVLQLVHLGLVAESEIIVGAGVVLIIHVEI